MSDDRRQASAWLPLFEDLNQHLGEQLQLRIAIYLREPFLSEYHFESSYPAISTCETENEMVAIATGAFARDEELAFVGFGPRGDLLTGEYIAAQQDLQSTVLFPFRINGKAGLSAVIAVSIGDEGRCTPDNLERIAERIMRHAGTLSMSRRTRLLGDRRDMVLQRGRDADSLLSHLVPDAFGLSHPRIAACAVIEGESRLANRVAFERVESAASPRVIASIAHCHLYLWSMGRPQQLFGLGSAGEPRWPLGRLAADGAFALFGLSKGFTPADAGTSLPQLDLRDLARGSSSLSSANMLTNLISARVRTERAARKVIGTVPKWRSGIETISDPAEPPDGNDLGLWCLGEKRRSAAIAEWNIGPGFLGAFTVRSIDGELPLYQMESAPWESIKAEIADPIRGLAWSRALAALVEYSSNAKKDCAFKITGQQLRQVSGSENCVIDIHGKLLLDGNTIRLTWESERCALDIAGNAGTMTSVWHLVDRYWPIATAAASLGGVTAELADPEFRYPPAQQHFMLVADHHAADARLRPRSEMWRSDHAQVIAESLASTVPPWLDYAGAVIGVPLGRSARADELSFDEWCSSGLGKRRMLLIAIPWVASLSDDELVNLIELLQVTQEQLAAGARRNVRDLDRVLVEHVRHDLGVLRSGFDVVSEIATRMENPRHDDRKLRHAIRDIFDRLSGLEMITGLYERIDSPRLVSLSELEGSVTLAIQLGAARARRKLQLESSHDERLMNTVIFDPPPRARDASTSDALAVLVLENVIGNAICAAETVRRRRDESAEANADDSPVRVDVTDGTIVVRNRCLRESWEYARQELKSGFPKSIGLAVVIQASQIAGMRVVAGDSGDDVAEVHLIPYRGAP